MPNMKLHSNIGVFAILIYNFLAIAQKKSEVERNGQINIERNKCPLFTNPKPLADLIKN